MRTDGTRSSMNAAPLAAALLCLLGCSSEPELDAVGGGQGLALAPEVDVSKLTLENVVLAAQAGYNATPAPGQTNVLNGTDLGWTFKHGDKLWIMYGDSWWLDPLNLGGRPDDSLGQISLIDYPDGASVEAFVRAHPAARSEPAWHAAAPTMQVITQARAGFRPVVSQQNGRELRSGVGAVPIIAFSNGRDGAAEGVFSVFFHYEAVKCESGQCPDGYQCDSGVGLSLTGSLTPPCVLGTNLSCGGSGGLCQDRGTNRYDASSNMGRTTPVLMRHAVGVTTAADPTHFETQPWATMRFLNSTGRTVTDFDPARADGAGNDYTPALGNSLARSGVFIWGRPHFAGIGGAGRDLRLYLLFAPMPELDNQRNFAWKPRFFSGLDSQQRPQFSERELDAKPLDLDAQTEGDQPAEPHDFVGQMNIAWLPSLQHFVMFYGGDSPGFSEGLLAWDDAEKIQRDPEGRLWVRFAKQPWGPWTAPRVLMVAGDRRPDAQPTQQYAAGGILAHNNCRGATCARYDPTYLVDIGNNNNGLLYGPSIIDAWTSANSESTALYWLLSTWNPYQVVLMKTTLRPE